MIEKKANFERPILLVSESFHNADMYYATGFQAPDRFVYFCSGSSETLLVSTMEQGRAKKESRVKDVRTTDDYGYTERLKELKDQDRALAATIESFLRGNGAKSVMVPKDFPLYLADLLRSSGIEVSAADQLFEKKRETKTPEEIEFIKQSQRVNEKALKRAIDMIKKSEPKEGVLYYKGKPLTAEMLQREIELTYIKNGCDASDTITACGPRSADPHFAGEGPVMANQPIVLDLFPYSKKTRYFADMTRTVVRGQASPKLKEMYALVLEAQQIAIAAIKPGVTGKYVNDLVCEHFEKHGYGTTRTKSKTGFIHSTGHGVGIEIHEGPSIGESGLQPLKAGNVVTVEPGLYMPEVGGVRIEDMVVVTEKGCIDITKFPKQLEV